MPTLARKPAAPPLDCFAVWPHHPDRLRRPQGRPARVHADLIGHALTWNLFRAFELLPPAFWLRRLHARMQNADTLGRAPVTARVSLWRSLEASPAQVIPSSSPTVFVDVLIETEHAVWTLLTTYGADLGWSDAHDAHSDPVGRMIDAGAWRAGRRDYFCGLIVRDAGESPLGASLIQRHSRPSRTAEAGVRGIGMTTWASLVNVLKDCAAADTFSPIERCIADSALDWIRTSDIRIG